MSNQACTHKSTPPTHITLFWHLLKLYGVVREFAGNGALVKNELLYNHFLKMKQELQH